MERRGRVAVLILGAALLAVPGGAGAQTLRFVVPEYSPFTGTAGGKAAGLGVDLVTKVLKEAGLSLSVRVVPNFGRCIAEVDAGSADGFFVGSKAADRDAVAVLSDRVLTNRWLWVQTGARSVLDPQAEDFRTKADIGVILNSNPHTWLKDHGYRVTGTPNNVAGLLTMLDAHRFDAVLVPELVFLEGLKARGEQASAYRQTVEVEQAMGIYLSKKTLAANPGLMDRINAAIRRLKL